MQLNSLSISGLHGALNLKVPFNDEITLLVGINGSGKTSVLNVIEWLLKPNMKQLAVASYDELSLSFTENDTAYVITATKTDSLVTLNLSGSKTALEPITIKLLSNVDPDDEKATEHYAQLGPEKHERPMWDLLKSFGKPTAISLDRTISAESDEIEYIEAPRNLTRRRIGKKSQSEYVQEITSVKYAEFRTKAIQNDSELKAQLVISALQDPNIVLKRPASKPKSMSIAEIAKLEEKVISHLTRTIKSQNIAKQIHSFFASSRVLAEKKQHAAGQHDLLLGFVTSRYRQIERLAKAFNDFETKNGKAFLQLRDYLSAINRFFTDSKKELYFDESTGQLVFSFVDAQSRKRLKRSISHLSSGEHQILILFTFLALVSRSQSVFIVDEPELSLHPKWQHEFMEAFLKLRPPGTQLLMATHSPDIVGRFKSACVTLRRSQG
jgi:predicted ATP-dependent endonuclease of OLD family